MSRTSIVPVPRRTLYRRAKRLLLSQALRVRLGSKSETARKVREFLRGKRPGYLLRLLGCRAAVAAAMVTLIAGCSGGGGGSGVALARAIDLYDIASGDGGFAIGGSQYDHVGSTIAGAGDVNGDGLDDVIIGVSDQDVGSNRYAGRSYVAFGKTGTDPLSLTAISSGVGGFSIDGIAPSDASGRSVAGAGDVNGDGLDDVIIGARYAAGGLPSTNAGESYVVFGKADTAPVALSSVALGTGGGFVILGTNNGDSLGVSVSGAGDVNGDGLSDVVVGASGASPSGRFRAGASYVVFGKADTFFVSASAISAGTGGFAINGAAATDRSGSVVSGAGDVNGDGLEDIIVGAPVADPNGKISAGESYVVFGKADGAPVELSAVSSGTGGFVIYGDQAFDYSGWDVSGAGDVNGDGLSDLLVGAPGAAPDGFVYAGKSYLIFGKADTAPVFLSNVEAGTGGFVILGTDIDDQSGTSVSGANDINGDGLDDLLVGARRADTGDASEALNDGHAYVVYGKTDTAPIRLSEIEAGVGGLLIHGGRPRDYAGQSVSGVGDVNGDGFFDMLIGAPGVGPGNLYASPGAACVVFNPFAP